MKNLLIIAVFASAAAGASAWGQMHKVAKPQQVVRAVGVYEWTGDMAKPTASRLIPVSLYINGKLEDAGVYLARPVPFALLTGNVYELEDAGKDHGLLDLVYARHMETGDGDLDNGWLGYGTFTAEAAAKKAPALQASKTLPKIVSSGDDSRPHFATKGGTAAPAAGTKDGGTASKPEEGGSSADDPDRPTMKRRDTDTASTTASAGSTAGSSAGSEPADDPDRPTLKRRTPEESKKAKAEAESTTAGAVESLNDDPNRPNLHYGKPASAMTEADLPRLMGMPPSLHQMVAVSDAADRDPHDFSRPWADTAEREAILQKMEEMARAKLTEYEAAPLAAVPAAAPKKTVHGRIIRRRATTKTAAAAPAIALMDEQLKGYTLSYGGAATYVLMAHTAGSGAELRYVTVVAQADDLGNLKPALQNVTDAAHLNRTPEMKFIDVVDADASNRASMLLELRAQNSRQFALYRVIAAEAQLIFLSGPTQ